MQTTHCSLVLSPVGHCRFHSAITILQYIHCVIYYAMSKSTKPKSKPSEKPQTLSQDVPPAAAEAESDDEEKKVCNILVVHDAAFK